MTVTEFLDELERCKKESAAHKRQMEVNLDYANHYEGALSVIAKMCGYKIPEGSCHGIPEDIDKIALRLVSELVKRTGQ